MTFLVRVFLMPIKVVAGVGAFVIGVTRVILCCEKRQTIRHLRGILKKIIRVLKENY